MTKKSAPGFIQGLVISIIALGAGYGLAQMTASSPPTEQQHEHPKTSAEPTIWTCSMHPSVKLPEFGKCPIRLMDLIPLKSGSDDHGPVLTMSNTAIALADVETQPVQRRFVQRELRLLGRISSDETRRRAITAWTGGRLDRLFVDYTGVTVREGDHLVSLYSPALISASAELIQAAQALRELSSDAPPLLRKASAAGLEAAQEN